MNMIKCSDCKVVHAKIKSNFLPHLATKQFLKNIFNFTFDHIYSHICELFDIYFSCKNVIAMLNLNKKSKC